jgi:hypothetical protein
LPGPIAEGRKPAGKGLSTGADLWKSDRACLGWRGNAPAKGQAGAGGFDAGQIHQEKQRLRSL